jgi:hypothetical protein
MDEKLEGNFFLIIQSLETDSYFQGFECWMDSQKVKITPFCHSCGSRNPGFKMVPCFHRDNVWTPAGVYPVLDAGPE